MTLEATGEYDYAESEYVECTVCDTDITHADRIRFCDVCVTDGYARLATLESTLMKARVSSGV